MVRFVCMGWVCKRPVRDLSRGSEKNISADVAMYVSYERARTAIRRIAKRKGDEEDSGRFLAARLGNTLSPVKVDGFHTGDISTLAIPDGVK